jgi:hypothetical protein
MTIQEWGSLGEIVAAIATVVTLLYLALQMRANAAATRSEARAAHRTTIETTSLAIAQDPKLAVLFRAGLTDFDVLTPDQKIQFSFLLGLMVAGLDAAFEHFNSGLLENKQLDAVRNTVEPFLLAPGGRAWWKAYCSRYSPEFQEFVGGFILAND